MPQEYFYRRKPTVMTLKPKLSVRGFSKFSNLNKCLSVHNFIINMRDAVVPRVFLVTELPNNNFADIINSNQKRNKNKKVQLQFYPQQKIML